MFVFNRYLGVGWTLTELDYISFSAVWFILDSALSIQNSIHLWQS